MRVPRLLRRRRTHLAAAILFLGLGSVYWFQRNYHFRFDSHEAYDTSFLQWAAGWFGDFSVGPLDATLIPGPDVPDGDYTPRTYRWYLQEQLPSARLLAFLADKDGMRFALAEWPETRELLVHCWSERTWEKFDYLVEARHVSNDPSATVAETERIGLATREATSMTAWRLDWIDIETRPWSSRLFLGEKVVLPGETPREDWTFHIRINGEDDSHHRVIGDFVIAYDWEARVWRIFDRDWHEFEAIDSWIRVPAGYVPNETLEGFSF